MDKVTIGILILSGILAPPFALLWWWLIWGEEKHEEKRRAEKKERKEKKRLKKLALAQAQQIETGNANLETQSVNQ